MRYTMALAAALALAAVHAMPAAAQSEVNAPMFAAATTPLPAVLTPEPSAPADDAMGRISGRHVLMNAGLGTLVGAGTGLLVGAVTAESCQPGEWCIFGWEEQVALATVAGAVLGAGAGTVYGLVTSPRRTDTRPAPVTVAPSTDGAVTVGMTLRH